MPRTKLCNQCNAILNLPDHVQSGKRMKCPRCGFRFVITQTDASSASTVPGLTDAAPASMPDMPRRPPSEVELPSSLGDRDLRESLDLPLMSGGRESERDDAGAGDLIGDASSLLADDPPKKRKQTLAEARAQARRCSACGGIVPKGMSTCISCGLDQETGQRVGWDDDLVPAPPPRPAGPPFHVAIIGGLAAAGALILLLLCLTQSVKAVDWRQYVWVALALIAGFAIYAAVDFIRGRSTKFMMVALTLGIMGALVGLIVEPIVSGWLNESSVVEVKSTDLDVVNVAIAPPESQLDTSRITFGVGLIVIFSVLYVYLMSSPVKKYIHLSRVGGD
jgi:hypothetical protein